ncbi:alpha/beta-hydrolase [Lentithecium fluviatile CBS 122367]|uniref:Alpha/beta-hydrolase n=1 Tax=Lentithecium fluviatile CBS 122367 TaxID=1168545 RepID=A0A6G1IHD3_9PLEO|nr:alpha/beta-hydrolase [Lentithecium fluviatile CBS 122367]
MAHFTRQEVLKSGEVAPEYRKAFEARPLDIQGADFFETRAKRAEHLQKLRHLYPIPGPIPDQVTETMHEVPTRDGSTIRARLYQPVKSPPEGGSPLVLMFHEGGWSMGDLTDEDLNCRMFARDLGCVCVNLEYRLAPEFKFPIGVNDCWDALVWATTNAASLGATPTRGLIVGGASAGGNIAAVLALHSRDTGFSPPITGQYLCVPALLPHDKVPARFTNLYTSRTDSISDPVLGKLDVSPIMQIYAPDADSPLWDPFNHAQGHKSVGKAFFQVGGLDPLRDEAVLYDRVLREAGVLTRFELYGGYGHMFWTNYPELKRSTEFVRDTLQGVRWLLEG